MHTLTVITSRKFVPVGLSFPRLKQNLGGHRFEDDVEVATVTRADTTGTARTSIGGEQKSS
jgi:hypothetical protein